MLKCLVKVYATELSVTHLFHRTYLLTHCDLITRLKEVNSNNYKFWGCFQNQLTLIFHKIAQLEFMKVVIIHKTLLNMQHRPQGWQISYSWFIQYMCTIYSHSTIFVYTLRPTKLYLCDHKYRSVHWMARGAWICGILIDSPALCIITMVVKTNNVKRNQQFLTFLALPGGCFTNVSRALQDILLKFVYYRNRSSYENIKLKLCMCAQSMAHVQSFSLKFSP